VYYRERSAHYLRRAHARIVKPTSKPTGVGYQSERGQVMSEVLYLASVLMALAAYAVAGVALWGAVEGAYWLYCKATGRDY